MPLTELFGPQPDLNELLADDSCLAKTLIAFEPGRRWPSFDRKAR